MRGANPRHSLSMNYELAKKLKEAGFPQHDDLDAIFPYAVAAEYARGKNTNRQLVEEYEKTLAVVQDLYSKDTKEYARIPTLSKLIEACGGGVLLWGCKKHGWYASEQFCPTEHTIESAIEAQAQGTTPEEVVANLWLTLHST